MAAEPLGLLRGARAIAAFLDGDDEHWREVPALAKLGFPIFKANGQWRARPAALAQEIEARERKAAREAADRAADAAIKAASAERESAAEAANAQT